ncbi:hypothetical protein [Erythrobacter ani]|uniref:Sugar transporter n=1 Tax=Erythrobacter ani TaxID=2827235 RepID=A0ABS6SIG4_9SPHN|nr:hypothetical protein [Erythrobacter ani]MBV7264805.1 hypothetical protein [Erythrobacter ani]
MNRIGDVRTPWHLWVIGVVSLLWNAVGAASYTMTELGMLEGLGFPPEQLAYFYGFPAWAVAFWALGVWGCLFGSLALLIRSKWAVWLFGISIVGLLGTTYYQRAVAAMPDSMQTTGQDVFAAVIWIITIGLFFYASRMKRAGVLR